MCAYEGHNYHFLLDVRSERVGWPSCALGYYFSSAWHPVKLFVLFVCGLWTLCCPFGLNVLCWITLFQLGCYVWIVLILQQ